MKDYDWLLVALMVVGIALAFCGWRYPATLGHPPQAQALTPLQELQSRYYQKALPTSTPIPLDPYDLVEDPGDEALAEAAILMLVVTFLSIGIPLALIYYWKGRP